MTDIREKIKAKTERDAEKYGIAFAKHKFGEDWPEEFPDQISKCAYDSGAELWAKKCLKLVEALREAGECLSASQCAVLETGKNWLVAKKALEDFEKELEG